MNNIAVGINFSSQSKFVLKYAFKLAQYFNASLSVVWILDPEDTSWNRIPVKQGMTTRQLLDINLENAEKRLTAFIEEYHSKAFADILVASEVRYGYSDSALRMFTQEINADALVIGASTKPSHFLTTATSAELVAWNPCPLIVLPENYTFAKPDRFVYASDFMLEDCDYIFFLEKWMETFDANLVVLHIANTEAADELADKKLRTLKRIFPNPKIKFKSIRGNIDTGIERFAQLSKSDFICTLLKQRSLWSSLFHKSITKEIAKDSEIPMIIFQQY